MLEHRSDSPGPATDTRADGAPEQDGLQGAIAQLQATLETRFEQLLGAFQEKLAFDRFKEEQIARLHTELQSYRSDLVARTARPFIQALVRLHDEFSRVLESLRQQDPATLQPDRFFKLLESFRDEVEVLLDQNGVEVIREPGTVFNPRTQRVLRTAPTCDPTQAGQVLEHLRPGFRHGEHAIEKERVCVAVYAAPERPPGPADPLAEGEERQP